MLPIPQTPPTHSQRPAASGFTLVELLIVVTIMGIVAAVILPYLEPGAAAGLEATGSIVVADLDYARQLAVVNQTTYSVDFAASGTGYTIAHSGSDSNFDALPSSPFRRPTDPANQHICRFADLPQAGMRVEFVAIQVASTVSSAGQLEFGPLGSLASGNQSTIYLAAGVGRSRFYLPIVVNATTGLATVGELSATNPLVSEGSDEPNSS